MFAPETTTFLEGGSALLVGTVGADGAPHASRGWGLTVLAGDAGEVRLLLDAGDTTAVDNLAATAAIAITATNVRTLRSLQCKGEALAVEPATNLDADRSAQYRDEFFSDIAETDGVPRELADRLVPGALVVCTVRVRELFDQTPGPAAGAPVEPGRA